MLFAKETQGVKWLLPGPRKVTNATRGSHCSIPLASVRRLVTGPLKLDSDLSLRVLFPRGGSAFALVLQLLSAGSYYLCKVLGCNKEKQERANDSRMKKKQKLRHILT